MRHLAPIVVAYLITTHITGPWIRKTYYPSLKPGFCAFNPFDTSIADMNAESERLRKQIELKEVELAVLKAST